MEDFTCQDRGQSGVCLLEQHLAGPDGRLICNGVMMISRNGVGS